jgi:hypothetical protein
MRSGADAFLFHLLSNYRTLSSTKNSSPQMVQKITGVGDASLYDLMRMTICAPEMGHD